MSTIVKTQHELDAAVKAGAQDIVIDSPAGVWLTVTGSSSVVARGSSSVEAWGSSRVEARDSSRVEARGSSSVEARGSSRVEARGSSSVEAWGSSRVVAWGSSSVEARGSSRVEARGSSRVEAWDSSRVVASKYVAVHLRSKRVTLSGEGVVIDVTDLDLNRVEDYLDYHGVAVNNGWATVYKAVDDDLCAGHAHTLTWYPVGGTVTAPDWDGKPDCGGGLHFGHRPAVARSYFVKASRFLECRVRVKGLIALGDKVKAESCVVVREVDIHGEAVES